jgi:hypothetical protein
MTTVTEFVNQLLGETWPTSKQVDTIVKAGRDSAWAKESSDSRSYGGRCACKHPTFEGSCRCDCSGCHTAGSQCTMKAEKAKTSNTSRYCKDCK